MQKSRPCSNALITRAPEMQWSEDSERWPLTRSYDILCVCFAFHVMGSQPAGFKYPDRSEVANY